MIGEIQNEFHMLIMLPFFGVGVVTRLLVDTGVKGLVGVAFTLGLLVGVVILRKCEDLRWLGSMTKSASPLRSVTLGAPLVSPSNLWVGVASLMVGVAPMVCLSNMSCNAFTILCELATCQGG